MSEIKKTCEATDAGHLAAHAEVWANDLDVMECSDIHTIAHLMCELGDKHQTSCCDLLYVVVLSLNSFQANTGGTLANDHAIEYWQDKARDWFPEFYEKV